jgi:hypothetical protein
MPWPALVGIHQLMAIGAKLNQILGMEGTVTNASVLMKN